MLDYKKVMPEVPWQDAYPYLQEQIRLHLKTIEPLEYYSTKELVEMLIPERIGGDSIIARQRVFVAIERMKDRSTGAHYLQDCFDYSEPRRMAGRSIMIRAKLWHYPNV